MDVLRRSQVLHQVALEQLPEHDPFRTLDLTSCAVVGSAAGLKGGGAGTAIDKHTAVFRFNEAPTKSYEKDVGAYGLPPLPPVTSLHLLTAPPPQNLLHTYLISSPQARIEWTGGCASQFRTPGRLNRADGSLFDEDRNKTIIPPKNTYRNVTRLFALDRQGPRPHCVSRTRSVLAAASARASCAWCAATAC